MKHRQPVAIVGIGGLFPESPNLERFWDTITCNRDTSTPPPAGRWLLAPEQVFDPVVGAPDKVYSKKGCFVNETDFSFASESPGVDPNIIKQLDPMFHMLLHSGQKAFQDGRIQELDRSRVGVIIGNLALPSELSSALARDLLGQTFAEKLLGSKLRHETQVVAPFNRYVAGLPAGLLAKILGLGGTCYTLDAACASSLYAIKLAVDELQSGRADAMLTGGLSRPDPLYTQMGFSQLHALSPSGTCSPFDIKGDGLVVGEGCGMFLLKRTEDAIRDGDHIYAVIKGIGLSNDIGGSLLAPVSEGQLRAMRAAYQQAGWTPQDIDLIECHATGTPVGDVVEFSSLKHLWGERGWEAGQCVIGSVKSNIGHLLTAAGSAALMKTLLALKERTLPPTANFNQAAQGIDLAQSPFRILKEPAVWKSRLKGQGRRAAVSAFGFGGINAHLLIEEWIPQQPKKSSITYLPSVKQKTQPVAIVGMAAHIGPWDSLQSLSQRLLGGDVSRKPTLPARWWGAQNCRWFKERGLKQKSFQGYFVNKVETSASAFRIPPKEVEDMLPRQLLMLKVAGEALEDAGLNKEDLLFTGIFIGAGLDLNATNFSFRWGLQNFARDWAEQLGLNLSPPEFQQWVEELRKAAGPALNANRVMGALGSIVASRIAKEFRVGGPSFTVCSEDNSGLRALEVGIRSLQGGAINRAIVGATDMAGDLRSVIGQHALRPFSERGEARPFDRDADGPLIGEGAAAVILKRLDDAKQDGDRIYAVIKGVGTASGDWVLRTEADKIVYQSSVERALKESGVEADTIGFLETHGSGIPAEDVLEAKVLGERFSRVENRTPCYFGSSKADVGHVGAASGLVSLIKSAVCIHQQILPPLRNLSDKQFEWVRGKRSFLSPSLSHYWLRNRHDGPRRALVAGVGVDGTCSHVVLEGFGENEGRDLQTFSARPLGPLEEGLFVLESDDIPELIQKIAQLREFAAMSPADHIEELAVRWFKEKELNPSQKRCLSFVAASSSELLEQLEHASKELHRFQQNPDPQQSAPDFSTRFRDRIFFSANPLGHQGKVAFVYPGSGNHFAGMGQILSALWPAIYHQQDVQNLFLYRQYLPQHFWTKKLSETINDNHNALVMGQVAIGTAVSDLIRFFGIRPEAVIGYSLGESAGLFSLRTWQDRDGMEERLNASTLFTKDLAGPCNAARSVWGLTPGEKVDWILGIVDASAEKVQNVLASKGRVYLLIINTYRECVIGGDRCQVEEVIRELGAHFFPLHGVTTVHCPVVKPVASSYRDLHVFPVAAREGVTFYSGASGQGYQVTSEKAADAILAQALDTVDYTRVIERAYHDGVRIFLEMGPGNSCSRMIAGILDGRPHLAKSVCSAGLPPASQVLRFLGHCLSERVPVDLRALYPSNLLPVKSSIGQQISTIIGGEAFNPPLPTAQVQEAKQPRVQISQVNVVKNESDETPGTAAKVWDRSSFVREISDIAARSAKGHEAYLRFAQTVQKVYTDHISFQEQLAEKLSSKHLKIRGDMESIRHEIGKEQDPDNTGQTPEASPDADILPALNRKMCMEFAVGSIAKVLGPDFEEVDTYPTRVRLPDEPLMLVDRILDIEGEARSMTGGRVVTEHDVTPGRWYLDGGHIPTCIAVEAGQADLFLSGYLGIDFQTKGQAVYRLLDAVVTFHRGLPEPGDVIRYDIRIDHFFRQGQTYLFRFHFESTVNGEPLLTMKDGCAGFFNEQELASGKGIVHTGLDLMPLTGTKPKDWKVLVPMQKESYDEDAVQAIYEGDLQRAFGPHFSRLELNRPYTLPGGRLKLVDRVIELDPEGGRYGLGLIKAEMDIHPEDWFLTCHFCDDHVMPGTLMYECCLHTLRIYLLRMGWIGEEGTTWCEPVPGVQSGLKCRGQVVSSTKTVTYQVTLKELGYGPEPFAIVDALMFADGKPIVEIPNMSVRLAGLDRHAVEALWTQSPSEENKSFSAVAPESPPLYDYQKILAFSAGNPSEAFGEPYRIFDRDRVIARLPRPPFQFLDRITEVSGDAFQMTEGASCVAQYDVPEDAWYFQAGGQPEMPFSILLETGLQPCGWLAAYIGSALTSPIDLKFRNLDGHAVQYRPVTQSSGTLTTRAKINRVARSAGMIVQGYEFEISDQKGPVYGGETVFGFFSAEALAHQVGLRNASFYQPAATETVAHKPFVFPTGPPFPQQQLRMIDEVPILFLNGGPNELGLIRGRKDVDPDEWYFKAHFFQDPVCPGSLGLESLLQLMKLLALKRWPEISNPVFETMVSHQSHRWNYRGQIVPSNKEVEVEAIITTVDDRKKELFADGILAVDGKIIYQMKDFSLRLKDPP